jgi:hypothetical protein
MTDTAPPTIGGILVVGLASAVVYSVLEFVFFLAKAKLQGNPPPQIPTDVLTLGCLVVLWVSLSQIFVHFTKDVGDNGHE